MNKFKITTLSSALLLSAFLMTGCGGGGGGGDDSSGGGGISFDGNTSPAAIDADNAEAIGTASGEAVEKASASNGLPGSISASSVDTNNINAIVLSTADTLILPAGSDVSAICDGGGSAHTDGSPQSSGPVTFTITYDNCVSSSINGTGTTIDGTVTLDYEDIGNLDAGFSLIYSNFTVSTSGGGTTVLNLTVICTDSFNCTYNSDFVGSDGATHRVTNFSVIGNATDGYNGNATFFHGTYGEVSITISGITYSSSCGVIPNGGTIEFTSTSSSGTITFNPDCTVSGTWTNSSGSGSF